MFSAGQYKSNPLYIIFAKYMKIFYSQIFTILWTFSYFFVSTFDIC